MTAKIFITGIAFSWAAGLAAMGCANENGQADGGVDAAVDIADTGGTAEGSDTWDTEEGTGTRTGDDTGTGETTDTGTGEPPDTGVDTSDPYDAHRQACVDKINDYRATLGLAPYARWTEAESCSDDEAKSDSQTSTAHGAFGQCGEMAQNECPGWGSLDSIVNGCLDMMWDEGPGEDFQKHGHYINMSSTQYAKVACGFYATPQGSVWAVQNFR